ncbi:MAG: phosphoribosylglycinamide formyltransferase [Syntrophobacteraceae bacterium]
MAGKERTLRLGVLVSGGGTNLQALIDRSRSGDLAAEVVVVAGDNGDAYGLVRAQSASIPTHVVDYRATLRQEPTESSLSRLPCDLVEIDRRQRILKNPDPSVRRKQLARLLLAEQEMIEILDRYRPDYICLAGFMRLVTPYFLSHFNRDGQWRVLNIHPALLPAFPGQHGYDDTFHYGSKWGGITVHFVDEGEDTGPIIAQAPFPIWPNESLESIRKRGLSIEYDLYAQCVNWLAADQVRVIPTDTGRTTTIITDPLYPDIVAHWMRLALTPI